MKIDFYVLFNRVLKIILLFFVINLFFLVFLSCSYEVQINVNPQDAEIFVNFESVQNGKIFKTNDKIINLNVKREGYENFSAKLINSFFKKNIYYIELKKKIYTIKIDVDEGKSFVYFEGRLIGSTPLKYNFEYGKHRITLKREGYSDQSCIINAIDDLEITFHHHKEYIPLEQIGIFKSGSQPKQVIFSPDDSFIFIPLLNADGCDIFDMKSLKVINRIKPEKGYDKKGFVEGIFCEKNKVFLLSQMSTNMIHKFDYSKFQYLTSFYTGGNWPKFIAYSKKSNLIAISNWISNSVSLIDFSNGEIIKKIYTDPVPRGITFTKDGSLLIITTFEGGTISLIETKNFNEIKKIKINGSALRHVVLSPDESYIYVSDMAKALVYQIDLKDFKICSIFKVDSHPNTIDISIDGRYLFVSCRGPNNPASYLLRSPANGSIIIIDLFTKKKIISFTAGNQPTGLDISNNGKFLAFSNFMDDTIEIFSLENFLNLEKLEIEGE